MYIVLCLISNSWLGLLLPLLSLSSRQALSCSLGCSSNGPAFLSKRKRGQIRRLRPGEGRREGACREERTTTTEGKWNCQAASSRLQEEPFSHGVPLGTAAGSRPRNMALSPSFALECISLRLQLPVDSRSKTPAALNRFLQYVVECSSSTMAAETSSSCSIEKTQWERDGLACVGERKRSCQ